MISGLRRILFRFIKKESFLGKLIDRLLTKEIIVYLVFGVLTTAVNWAIYTVLVRFTGAGITVSNAVAWVGAVVFAFITNKIWVFESRVFRPAVVVREFVSFVAARAATGALEIFGVPLLVKIGLDQKIFGIDGAVAKIIVSVTVIILNYIFSKVFIFRKGKNSREEK